MRRPWLAVDPHADRGEPGTGIDVPSAPRRVIRTGREHLRWRVGGPPRPSRALSGQAPARRLNMGRHPRAPITPTPGTSSSVPATNPVRRPLLPVVPRLPSGYPGVPVDAGPLPAGHCDGAGGTHLEQWGGGSASLIVGRCCGVGLLMLVPQCPQLLAGGGDQGKGLVLREDPSVDPPHWGLLRAASQRQTALTSQASRASMVAAVMASRGPSSPAPAHPGTATTG